MSARPRIVVYLGPTLAAAEATAILPGAEVRPPARRGDLYGDRNDGTDVLLVVDGQFLQEDAVSPREVIDVVRDGACVYGASSIGALRAAECWPVGVRGVGLVYRLFRSGRLHSDDEVAVAADAAHGYRATSVALVNVRYAVTAAVRAGLVDRWRAARIVECARRRFYADRTWPAILTDAGCADDRRLGAFVAASDVKRQDALKLLRQVATRRAAGAESHSPADGALRPRRRQPHADALLGRPPDEWELGLTRWMVGAGRGDPTRLPAAVSPVGVPTRLNADHPGFSRRLWDVLAETGELDAELMRLHAVNEAVAVATALGVRPRAVDRFLAESAIAARYRSASWDDVRRTASARGIPWDWVEAAATRLAVAQRVRAELVERPVPPLAETTTGSQ